MEIAAKCVLKTKHITSPFIRTPYRSYSLASKKDSRSL